MSHIGDKIRALREERGFSQKELARAAGIRQQSLGAIEAGRTHKSKFLPNIAIKLGVPLSEIDPSIEPVTVTPDTIVPESQLFADTDLPVYATSRSGAGHMVLSIKPVERVRRPAPLSTVQDGYGVIISDRVMEPEVWSGGIAFVHPHLPPLAGRTHVFYADNERDGQNGLRIIVRHLLEVTDREWIVRQWRPMREQRLLRREWRKCHRVVATFSPR